MSSTEKSENKTAIRLLEEDVEKGISEKKAQNLVLKKILDAVEAEKQAGEPVPESRPKKKNSNK